MSAAFTPGPWVFGRMESAVEFAELKGETLAEHEGYYRDNNGDWIVTHKSDDEFSGGRIAGVTFQGKAKRGETYKAPDPEGQANARLIAAAPELYEALDTLASLAKGLVGSAYINDAETALAKARGDQ